MSNLLFLLVYILPVYLLRQTVRLLVEIQDNQLCDNFLFSSSLLHVSLSPFNALAVFQTRNLMKEQGCVMSTGKVSHLCFLVLCLLKLT